MTRIKKLAEDSWVIIGCLILWAALALVPSGCSTYAHEGPEEEPTLVGDGGITREGSGKCHLEWGQCCNFSSCAIPCRDGYVCMMGACHNVMKLIMSAK